ncbi:hypothetical protein [Viscerimonas tarda]
MEDNNASFPYLEDEGLAHLNTQNNVAIFIYTNKDGGKRRENKGIRPTKLAGYSVASEYYRADYSKGIPANEKDYRRTLYWNPDLKTDATGKASINFYNNSVAKQLDISAERLSSGGLPVVSTTPPPSF